MAVSTHLQSWIVSSVDIEEVWDQRKHSNFDFLWMQKPWQCENMLGPSYPDSRSKITMEALWIEALLNPSCIYCEGLSLPRERLGSDDDELSDELKNDVSTLLDALRACGKDKDMEKGAELHDDILKKGLLKYCSDALIVMYAKCNALVKAKGLLDVCESKDIASWNALIAGYTNDGQGEQALKCFEQMRRTGLSPNAATYTSVLKACGSVGLLEKGEQFHNEISRQGLLERNVVVGSSLVDMYAKCGALDKARKALEELPARNVITWSSLITGYIQQGQGEQALVCLDQMQSEGLSPNAVTFASILKACGSIGAIDKGEEIHEEITRQGLLRNDVVLATAVVDMYAKCGALAKAMCVLEELPIRNITTWNALIAGYVQQGQGEEALDAFKQLQRQGLNPNAVTFSCILKACGSLQAIDRGEQVHGEIVRQGLSRRNMVLGSALVDMYAKCGALLKAEQVLEDMPSRNVVTWSALVTGYAQQGQGEQALLCFEQMQHEGVAPDTVVFSCVLNACSHLGLVEDGHRYFLQMSRKYGLKPDVKQYACLVDLFGRAGHLDKAVEVIQEMPSCSDYPAMWSALLAACQKWGDVNAGRWVFERAVEVDKSDAALYILMANIYSAAGMQEDAEVIESRRKKIEASSRQWPM